MARKWAGERKARENSRRFMTEARDARRRYLETGDPVYKEIARVHRMTARAFRRNAWRGPKR